jgi:hypothetical protein
MRHNGRGNDGSNFCAILGFLQGATFGHVLSAMAASSLASLRGQGNNDGGGNSDCRLCAPPGHVVIVVLLIPV